MWSTKDLWEAGHIVCDEFNDDVPHDDVVITLGGDPVVEFRRYENDSVELFMAESVAPIIGYEDRWLDLYKKVDNPAVTA